MTTLDAEVRDLLVALVAVDSQNPSLAAGAVGEAEIADLITGWAVGAGLDAERFEPTAGRPSLLNYRPRNRPRRGPQTASVRPPRHCRHR